MKQNLKEHITKLINDKESHLSKALEDMGVQSFKLNLQIVGLLGSDNTIVPVSTAYESVTAQEAAKKMLGQFQLAATPSEKAMYLLLAMEFYMLSATQHDVQPNIDRLIQEKFHVLSTEGREIKKIVEDTHFLTYLLRADYLDMFRSVVKLDQMQPDRALEIFNLIESIGVMDTSLMSDVAERLSPTNALLERAIGYSSIEGSKWLARTLIPHIHSSYLLHSISYLGAQATLVKNLGIAYMKDYINIKEALIDKDIDGILMELIKYSNSTSSYKHKALEGINKFDLAEKLFALHKNASPEDKASIEAFYNKYIATNLNKDISEKAINVAKSFGKEGLIEGAENLENNKARAEKLLTLLDFKAMSAIKAVEGDTIIIFELLVRLLEACTGLLRAERVGNKSAISDFVKSIDLSIPENENVVSVAPKSRSFLDMISRIMGSDGMSK